MHRKSLFLLLFLLLLSSLSLVNAQRNDPPGHYNKAPKSYKHLLTVHFQMNAIGSFFGGNIGVDYERFLDPQGYVSADVSLNYGAINDHFLDGAPYNYRNANPLYATTGIRVHPFGNARRADLSIGSQIGAGTVYLRSVARDNQGSKLTVKSELSLLTYIAEVNVNFHPEGRTVLGVHLGIGQHMAASDFTSTFFEFGLRIGSRF